MPKGDTEQGRKLVLLSGRWNATVLARSGVTIGSVKYIMKESTDDHH